LEEGEEEVSVKRSHLRGGGRSNHQRSRKEKVPPKKEDISRDAKVRGKKRQAEWRRGGGEGLRDRPEKGNLLSGPGGDVTKELNLEGIVKKSGGGNNEAPGRD